MLDVCCDFTATLKLLYSESYMATLKSENMVSGNLSLCGVNSCVSKFVWKLLYNKWAFDFMVTLNSLC